MDPCTQCSCSKGEVRCAVQQCPVYQPKDRRRTKHKMAAHLRSTSKMSSAGHFQSVVMSGPNSNNVQPSSSTSSPCPPGRHPVKEPGQCCPKCVEGINFDTRHVDRICYNHVGTEIDRRCGVHGVWRSALPDVRRASVQLPRRLQIFTDERLPQRQFLRSSHQRRPFVAFLFLDQNGHIDGIFHFYSPISSIYECRPQLIVHVIVFDRSKI